MTIETINNILLVLAVAWSLVTALLLFIWIYRSTLESREEDQLFLDSAGDMMAAEQREIVARIERLSRPIIALAVVSVTLLVAAAGLWIWQSLNAQPFS
jgi:multidrug efflux pump subunit AcrB